MIKKIILLIILVVLLVPITLAYYCEDETDIDNIPCEVISPVLTCTDYDYNVTASATGELKQSGNLTAVGDGTYKFTFDQTYGEYTILLCNSSTWGTIVVGDFEVTYEYALYLIAILALVILIVGFYKADYNIVAFSGVVMLILGVYIAINGLDTFDNYLTNAFAFIYIGIGSYVMMRGGYEIYKEM